MSITPRPQYAAAQGNMWRATGLEVNAWKKIARSKQSFAATTREKGLSTSLEHLGKLIPAPPSLSRAVMHPLFPCNSALLLPVLIISFLFCSCIGALGTSFLSSCFPFFFPVPLIHTHTQIHDPSSDVCVAVCATQNETLALRLLFSFVSTTQHACARPLPRAPPFLLLC